jgi:hypothetical protein
MAVLSDVVIVTLVVQDSVPATANFGRPLLCGHVPAAVEPAVFGVRSYSADLSGLQSLATDLGASYASTWIYGAAQTIASQNPHCADFAVSARPHTAGKLVRVTLSGTPAENDTVTATVYNNGVQVGSPVVATADATPTLNEMAVALVAGITALTGIDATIGATGASWFEVVPTTSTDKLTLTVVETSAAITVATLDVKQDLSLTVSTPLGVGEEYAVNVSVGLSAAVECSYVSQAGDAQADVLDELYTLLVAAGVDTTKIGSTTTSLKIRSGTAIDRVYFSGWGRTSNIAIADNSLDAGIGTDLAAAALGGVDYFGVLIDNTGKAELVAAATSNEAAGKLSLGLTTDDEAVNPSSTTDVLYVLNAATRHYTGTFASRDTAGMANVALMARQFSQNPGSSTWFGKALSGPTADVWSGTASGAIKTKKGLEYANIRGVNLTMGGWAASGRFLDITHGNSWLKYELESAAIIVIANAEKVPNTAVGRGMIEAAWCGVMATAETAAYNFVAPGWVVTVPPTSDPTNTPTNRVNRFLAGSTVTCTLSGALHSFSLTGTEAL